VDSSRHGSKATPQAKTINDARSCRSAIFYLRERMRLKKKNHRGVSVVFLFGALVIHHVMALERLASIHHDCLLSLGHEFK
jgi:hypothetical protein